MNTHHEQDILKRNAELEKELALKNRELEIEAALEKVRAVAMAMRKADDLMLISEVIYKQLSVLGFSNVRNVQIAIDNDEKQLYNGVEYSEYYQNRLVEVPYDSSPMFREIVNELKKSDNAFYQKEISGKEFKDWRKWRMSIDTKNHPDIASATSMCFYLHSVGAGMLGISTFNAITNDQLEILKRLRNVFELSYRRYIDIEKAESQAREAQIELALERVRARTMAMQKSDELREAVLVIYQQLQELDFGSQACNIIIIDKDTGDEQFWVSGFTQEIFPESYHVPRLNHHYQEDQFTAWRNGVKYAVFEYTGKEKKKFDKIFFTQTDFRNVPEQAKQFMVGLGSIKLSTAFTTYGSLQVLGPEPLSEEKATILKRFAKVFEQTYTRFLDLQKAEAQSRESQIELGLERVRARAMAMQKSDELSELVDTVFKELTKLDFALTWCIINIIDEPSLSNTVWAASPDINKAPESFHMLFEDYPFHHAMMKGWKERKTKHVYTLEGNEKKIYDEYLFNETEFKKVPEAAQAASRAMEKYVVSFSFSNFGGLQTVGDAPLSDANLDILSRFGKVFDLTYTRFNDLKLAEAQARESQIQLALERVRARTMAMQKSDELPQAANLLFQQIQSLGMPAWSAGYCIWDNDKQAITLSMSSEGVLQPTLRMPLTEDPSLKHFREAYERGESFFVEAVGGEALKEHYTYLRTLPGVKETLDDIEKAGFPVPTFQIFHLAYFTQGFLLFITYEQVSGSHEIFKRFAKVFEQTYTRFLDLQKAEAQAREARIQLSLERVRARGMAMHSSNELADLIDTVFKELTKLDIRFDRCLITIYDPKTYASTWWLANPEPGAVPLGLFVKYHECKPYLDCLNAWKERILKWEYLLEGAIKKEWDSFLFKETELSRLPELVIAGMRSFERIFLNVSFNNFGSLTVSTAEPLDETNADLLLRFAKVFDSTYTRFNDLKQAEAQARESQVQLALERVRARTMAMQKSDELAEAASLLFTQIADLGTNSWSSGFIIFQPDELSINSWMSKPDGSMGVPFNIPVTEDPFFIKIYEAYKRGEEFFVMESGGKELAETYRYMFGLPGAAKALGAIEDIGFQMPTFQITHCTFFPHGFLMFITYEPCHEMWDIFKRFGKVFEQTYTRFLDLQKAEAQAKESQIQLALERVRARTMAMQHSDELKEAAALLFQQAKALGVPAYSCGYNIWEKNDKTFTSWMSTQDGSIINGVPDIPLTEDANFLRYVESKQKGEQFFVLELRGERMQEHYEYLKTIPAFKAYFDYAISVGFDLPETQIHYLANFSNGNLLFITLEPCPEFHDVFKRFAAVFEQTYTRFLDLQKAEAQAREAQIEAALENVRSSSLAMHNSNELKGVVKKLFEKMKELGFFQNNSVMIVLPKNGFKEVLHWTFNENFETMEYFIPAFNHPVSVDSYKAWARGEKTFELKLNKEGKNHFLNQIFTYTDYSKVPDEFKKYLYSTEAYNLFEVFENHCGLLVDTFTDVNYSEDQKDVVKRFAKVFEQAYIRFLDLQKAEAQAREAQIETALERVRSRTMGMQKSEELKEVIQVVYDQFVHLNIHIEHTGFVMDYKARDDYDIWIADQLGVPSHVTIPYFDCVYYNRFNEAKKKGEDFFATNLAFEEKNKFYQKIIEYVPGLPEETKEFLFSIPGLAASTVLLENVCLYIENFSGIPYTDDENNTLMRFGKVFQQTYTRFLDLQKAEAQAREAQIEAALEKVRSRSLAMHTANELGEVVKVIVEKLQDLSVVLDANGVVLCTYFPNSKNVLHWIVSPDFSMAGSYLLPYFDHPIFNAAWNSKIAGDEYFSKAFNIEEKNSFFEYAFEHSDYKFFPEEFKQWVFQNDKHSLSFAWQKNSAILIPSHTGVLPTEADKAILIRFSKVFEQAYVRFLDLQKAEAQAREAKIEAALEKVRASTMAMQQSDHLSETAFVLFKQFKELGEAPERIFIATFDDEQDGIIDIWGTNQGGNQLNKLFKVSAEEPTVISKIITAWKEKKRSVVIDLSGEELKQYISFLRSTGMPVVEGIMEDRRVQTIGCFSKGVIGVTTPEPQSAESVQLLERFAGVFDLTYTRFLDLQQAEAQTREAKIEAALERVRSRTMAMQHSDELKDAALLLFQQVQSFGVDQWACGYNIWEADGKTCTAWMSRQGNIQPPFKTHPAVDHCFQHFYDAKQRGESFYVEEIGGDEIKTHYKRLISLPEFKSAPREFFDEFIAPEFQIFHIAYFEQGYLMFITYKPVPETWDIFKRFAKVFEQTYTRFLDLQKSEAQAREAIKQASVDRVRAEIASMRTTSDLERITPLVWNELKTLGVPFIRCGVFIIDEEHEQVHTFLSTPDGKANASFTSAISTVSIVAEALPYWRRKEMYKAHWDEATFIEQTKHLVEQGAVSSTNTYLTENRPKNLYLHLLPFLQGILYVGNETPLNDDELQLVQNLADAFSIAYARYDDFNKLELAKEQIENTLVDLKQTQAQLVQSEKMASLGELTAGIAHEIQNPLNFVNNFSEVNTELIAEMKEEIEKGNIEEVKAIANDIADNEQKINHHGKRADAIVKGMLQHSRSSSGVKEPSDINVLADEYLRLAYHGLRAKDKSFNATMKTDFDETIGKINIVPQDVGRAVLNLITNAFYVVAEKKKQIGNGLPAEASDFAKASLDKSAKAGYEPTVTVTTKKDGDKVFVSVKDNGNGIPQKVLDKIFQPFFTTKPTGQGTGLGLSLSYDIIKAHGGEINVVTKEGEGSEFIIFLPANN